MATSSRRFGVLPRETRFWHKVAAVCAVFFIPLGVLLYLYIGEKNKAIAFSEKELIGTEYLRPCRTLMEHVTRHRLQVRDQATGDGAGAAEAAKTAVAIEREVRALEQLDAKYGTQLSQDDRKTADFLAAFKDQWQGVRAGKGNADDAHQKLVGTLRQLIGLVGDTSNLILDPDLDSYYLMDSVLLKLPDAQDQFQSFVDYTEDVLARKAITPAEKTELVVRTGLIKASVDGTNSPLSGLRVAMKPVNDSSPDKSLATALDPALTAYVAAADGYLADVRRRAIEPEKPALTPADNARAAGVVLDANFRLWDESVKQLDRVLHQRVSGFTTAKWTALGIAGIAVVIAIGLAVLITRGVGRQIAAMNRLFTEFQAGNFRARAEVVTNDEVGRMAVTLNDNILPLVQSRDERDQIQQSIMKLLDDVSGLGNGDLTKEAEVTADMTGAIADSFNMMINELRKLVGRVQTAATQVNQSALQIHQTANHLVEGAESQAEQIVKTTAAIDEMAVSIQQVSDNAAVSTQVAQQSLTTAKNGSAAVENTIEGMARIRDQVQETAKRIKRLGESSQEIGQAIQLIDDIADRTSILALNASIQAAMAGEAGRGFAVVAEEVERLAVRSSDATKKIAALVKSIQGETTEAVGAMEKSIQEVVEGSRRANQAGQALGEIEDVSGKLADLIQAISQASKQQAKGSEALARSMGDISTITQQTANGTKETAESVTDLSGLAKRLNESVSAFKLPGAAKANGHAGENRLSGHFKRPVTRN